MTLLVGQTGLSSRNTTGKPFPAKTSFFGVKWLSLANNSLVFFWASVNPLGLHLKSSSESLTTSGRSGSWHSYILAGIEPLEKWRKIDEKNYEEKKIEKTEKLTRFRNNLLKDFTWKTSFSDITQRYFRWAFRNTSMAFRKYPSGFLLSSSGRTRDGPCWVFPEIGSYNLGLLGWRGRSLGGVRKPFG